MLRTFELKGRLALCDDISSMFVSTKCDLAPFTTKENPGCLEHVYIPATKLVVVKPRALLHDLFLILDIFDFSTAYKFLRHNTPTLHKRHQIS